MKNVLVLTGAGQIGLAIVRRIGSGMKIVVSDKNAANAASAALLLNNAGFDGCLTRRYAGGINKSSNRSEFFGKLD